MFQMFFVKKLVWSMGIVMLEITTGQKRDLRPSNLVNFNPLLVEVISGCLKIPPQVNRLFI